MIDFKEVSVLRPSPRFFRPSSVMRWQLWSNDKFYTRNVTYTLNSRLSDCKELSLLRPSARFFKPWSVILVQLLLKNQWIHARKSPLLVKYQVERLQVIESFQTFSEIVQTLIWDSIAAVENHKSISWHLKHSYSSIVRINDCKELLSPCTPWTRVLRSWSVIIRHL